MLHYTGQLTKSPGETSRTSHLQQQTRCEGNVILPGLKLSIKIMKKNIIIFTLKHVNVS